MSKPGACIDEFTDAIHVSSQAEAAPHEE